LKYALLSVQIGDWVDDADNGDRRERFASGDSTVVVVVVVVVVVAAVVVVHAAEGGGELN
jgi:hypothetical protein